MSFSAGFLELAVWTALIWCAVSALALAAMLRRDAKAGSIW